MTAESESRNPPGRRPGPPIPLSLLTGFLGAGKTTLLNRLLTDPGLSDTAVIVNEFGDVALDHLLVEKIDEETVVLASGCLCCTLRGDLVASLEKLLRNLDNGRAHFRRVIIETTGLADPAPLLQTAMTHPYLVQRFRLDGVITLIDAVNGLATLDAHREAVKQAAVADRIVLTKTDLLDTPDCRQARQRLFARLRAINPAAPVLDAAAGEAVPGRLLECGLFNAASKSPDVRAWLAEEAYAGFTAGHDHDHGHVHAQAQAHDHGHGHDVNRHDDRVRAFTLSADAAIPAVTLDLFLELLRAMHGPNLLRMKGIVRLAEEPDRPVVLHAVQHVLHPPARLEAWPDDDRRSRLVVIVRDIEPRAVRELFDAFLGVPAVDRPDRQALTDNPLVAFGGMDR